MKENYKNVIIIGMGKSGISSALFCLRQGISVTLYDSKDEQYFGDSLSELKEKGIELAFGSFDLESLKNYELMVLSPGVPTNLDFIVAAHALMPVIGEIELAYLYGAGTIVGITGTNGKTTTTTLVGEIISAYHQETYVVGNIGAPYTDVADSLDDNAIVVAELSSYQLESVYAFKPHVSCILNLTEDHLQRHKTMENYANAKLAITRNQTKSDYCILNYDDDYCRESIHLMDATVIYFSRQSVIQGIYAKDNVIYNNMYNKQLKIMNVDEIPVLGTHNVENVMAAIGICIAMKIPVEIIVSGIKQFKGVAHRVEFVDEIEDVKYYNDSKATNPDAAIKAVESMDRPTVLIAGGMDKESDYDPWIDTFDGIIKHIVLFGETKENIKNACLKKGFTKITVVENLEEAVKSAHKIAEPKENVLLSPACASWDMYKDFEQRGNHFKDEVMKLKA